MAEVRERRARDELRLALLASALAHLLEPVVDQVELQVVRIDALRVEPEYAHALELEGDAAGGRKVAAVLVEEVAYGRHGAGRVVGRRLDQDRHAVWGVALVEDHLEVSSIAP